MNTDGWVVIGTKLDDSGFDKGIKQMQNKKVETEVEVDPDLQGYELLAQMARQKAAELSQEAEITPSVNLRNIDNQLSEAYIKSSELINKLMEVSMEPSDDMGPLLGVINELDSVSDIIEELDAKREKLTGHVSEDVAEIKKGINSIKASSKDINTGLNNISNGISNTVKKVGRWALAVVGVSGAYMAIRRAISIVSAQNEKVANSFEQIQKVIAGALLPVVQTVINFIVKLMYYINYIWKFFTGKNLFNFADATKKSAKELRQAEKSSKGVSKNLKEAKNQLAGFDEMNVLQEPSDSSGGSGGGSTDPDFGNIFDKLKGVKIPKWLTDFLQWIKDHSDEVIAGLIGIAGALLALKLGFSPLQSLGIGLAIGGIVYAVKSLLDYLKDPSMENFGKVITGIGIAIAGVAIAFGAWPVALAGAIVAIIGIIIANWDKIKAFLESCVKWLEGKSEWVHKVFGDNIGKIYDNWVKLVKDVIKIFDDLIKALKKVFDGIIKVVKGIIKGDWKMVWEGAKDIVSGLFRAIVDLLKIILKTALTAIENALAAVGALFLGLLKLIGNMFVALWDLIKSGASSLWNGIKNVARGIGSWFNSKVIKPIKDFFSGMWGNIKDGATNAIGKVKNVFTGIPKWFKEHVIDKIIDKFKSLGTKVGNVIGGAFKSAVNSVMSVIENILNAPIRAINGLINKIKKVPGFSKLQTLSTFNLPRLAKGGIINMPGRGVPLALGGESGAEGVIPLTDNQQMELLGEAIGKYITINATITNTMNGRVISRELKKVQNESDFAFNR